jgi:hypothetical protein
MHSRSRVRRIPAMEQKPAVAVLAIYDFIEI